VKLVDSPIIDTRFIHDYPAFVQKLRQKCPKLTVQSVNKAIFIYGEMDQLWLQRHHYLQIKIECMMVHAHIMQTFNDPTAPLERQGREGYMGIKRNKIWQ
jgi:hypothetical protein